MHAARPAPPPPQGGGERAADGAATPRLDAFARKASERLGLPPYDPDPDEGAPMGRAPFIPPQIDKLIRVIMRHGKRDVAQRIVFDASHALYAAARPRNPRPELRQRHKAFVP